MLGMLKEMWVKEYINYCTGCKLLILTYLKILGRPLIEISKILIKIQPTFAS